MKRKMHKKTIAFTFKKYLLSPIGRKTIEAVIANTLKNTIEKHKKKPTTFEIPQEDKDWQQILNQEKARQKRTEELERRIMQQVTDSLTTAL